MPTIVASEAITGRLGDILLDCSNSVPGSTLTGNLSIFLTVSATNPVDANNQTRDIVLSADFGGGFVPTGNAAILSNQNVVFNGLSFPIPSTGRLAIKISNIRGNAFQVGPQGTIRASLAWSSTASIAVNQSQVTIGQVQPGLYATLYSSGIACSGSPLPSTIDLTNLFTTKTAFASTRLTEGFAQAFLPRGQGESTGTRFLATFSGFPAGARLFVPDFVAGSSAATPTSGGDLGLAQSVGQYVPGSHSLLLVRVLAPDSSGAGGFVPSAPNAPATLNTVSEVTLVNGAGYVVYEVLDSNLSAQESVQFPTFFGIPAGTAPAVAQERISLAPVSGIFTASGSAPVPRFGNTVPLPDCTVLGDCNSPVFPRLKVEADPLVQITSFQNGAPIGAPGYIVVRNTGGGIMNWTATISYQDGSGWLTFLSGETSGQNGAAIQPTPSKAAAGLAPGTYRATVNISAGALAGSASVAVVLTVKPNPAATPPSTGSGSGSTGTGSSGSGTGTPPVSTPVVTVSKVVNAATFEATPLVAGSLGTVMGSHLGGKSVSVNFDGTPATIFYTGDTQINLQVPETLASKTSASMVVTVDGASSAPQAVLLSPAWPSIFAHGVLNSDNSENRQGSAANANDILQIFGTGIPAGAVITVEINGQSSLLLYGGGAPGLAGVQQVNVKIPEGIAGPSTLVICAAAGGKQFCSAGYPLAVN